MPQARPLRQTGAKEALKILEDAYAYYTPAHVFVPGRPVPADYYEYCAA